jgi:glycosyltransferase involved in cell wall biosynthesis
MDQKKIRICHIITRLDKGGAPDVVRLVSEGLDPALFDVMVVYGRTVNPTEKTREWTGSLGSRALLVPALRRDILPLHDLVAFLCLAAILARGHFDVVHTHTAKAGILGRFAARLCGVRAIVHSPHGHDFYGYFNPFLSRLIVWAERCAAPFCDKIHVLTRLEEQDMLRYKICREEKMRVIPSGIATSSFIQMFSAASPVSTGIEASGYKRVGFVGRLESIKGPDVFIDMARFVASRVTDVRFLLIGDGSLRLSLERKVKEWGLEGFVLFLGWQEDVVGYLEALDVLVMPSLNEGVGRAALEAQAVGVPVVASRVGGIPEVVRDNETGLLFAPGDPAACAEAVIALLEDDGKRRRFGAAGRAWVRENYSVEKMVRSFESLYRSVLKK